jgi:hypothetical protein
MLMSGDKKTKAVKIKQQTVDLDPLRQQGGHPPIIVKNKKTKAALQRYQYLQSLINMANRNE